MRVRLSIGAVLDGVNRGALRRVDSWARNALAGLYPPTCLLCGEDAGPLDLCAGCLRELPRNRRPCPGCALPLPSTAGVPCGICQRRPPRFQGAIVPFLYDYPADHLVQALKFEGRLPCAPLMAALLARALYRRPGPRPASIVPVPLHPRRLRQRGFDHALELARGVGGRLAIPVDPHAVARVRDTPPQVGLAPRARRANARGAFAVTGEPARHVALLDDVVTTGATANELSRVLRRAGTERVEVWAFARTLPS